MPGFDLVSFPFIISCTEKAFELINISTGNSDILIQGSANYDPRQAPIFFRDHRDGRFELNFCIATQTGSNMFEHSWHCLEFNTDFKKFL